MACLVMLLFSKATVALRNTTKAYLKHVRQYLSNGVQMDRVPRMHSLQHDSTKQVEAKDRHETLLASNGGIQYLKIEYLYFHKHRCHRPNLRNHF